jgi:hypothetical protein
MRLQHKLQIETDLYINSMFFARVFDIIIIYISLTAMSAKVIKLEISLKMGVMKRRVSMDRIEAAYESALVGLSNEVVEEQGCWTLGLLKLKAMRADPDSANLEKRLIYADQIERGTELRNRIVKVIGLVLPLNVWRGRILPEQTFRYTVSDTVLKLTATVSLVDGLHLISRLDFDLAPDAPEGSKLYGILKDPWKIRECPYRALSYDTFAYLG